MMLKKKDSRNEQHKRSVCFSQVLTPSLATLTNNNNNNNNTK